MSMSELVAFVCCDLGSIVRGRSFPSSELSRRLETGVGWVPANHSLTPLGPLADHDPFGSTGDLRLMGDPDTHVRVEGELGETPLEFLLCDITEIDGRPWECCPRTFLREALAELERELGLRVLASFEHEFQLQLDEPPAPPFSLEAQRRAEPFAAEVMGALEEAGVQPELLMAEFADHQFEIPVEAAPGIASADRSIVLREVVRELARRHGMRASFAPLLDPSGPGNGVHIHLSLLDGEGSPVLYDPERPDCLSELGARFAAGILLHAGALSALTAPSPPSAARLTPHRFSAGAVCLARQNREALLRIPPLLGHPGAEPAGQMRLEYRGADATANPHLALAAILRAGLDGVRSELPPPPILEEDPSRLDPAEAARFGVGALPSSLANALQALADDATARGWFSPLLYDAYTGLKQSELEAMAAFHLSDVCTRYAAVY
jgi:glutamine synthetase